MIKTFPSWERKGLFSFYILIIAVIEERQGRNLSRVGTWRQEQMQKTCMQECCLLAWSPWLFTLLSSISQNHVTRDGTAQSSL